MERKIKKRKERTWARRQEGKDRKGKRMTKEKKKISQRMEVKKGNKKSEVKEREKRKGKEEI